MKTFLLALVLRLILFALVGRPYHAPDSTMYLSLADSFAFDRMPLYPAFLWAFGEHWTVFIQIFLDSMSAALIASLSPVGGLVYALSLGPIVYSVAVLTDTIAVFFITLSLWAAFEKRILILGGAILCAIFTREVCLVFVPFFLVLYCYGRAWSITEPEK